MRPEETLYLIAIIPWWIKVAALLVIVGWTAWSGRRPGVGDSRAWYDRTIRAVGGLILFCFVLFMIVFMVSRKA